MSKIKSTFYFMLIVFAAHNVMPVACAEDGIKFSAAIVEDVIANSDYSKIKDFKNVCLTGGDADSYCINQFKSIQVQPLTAVGLAKEFAKEKNGHDIICSPKIRTQNGQDYISCATDDGYYYEFKFDDVFESSDARILMDTREAFTDIYDIYSSTRPKEDQYYYDLLDTVRGKTIASTGQNACIELQPNALKFDMEFNPMENQLPYCALNQRDASTIINELAPIVRNDRYKNIQARLDLGLESLIGGRITQDLLDYNIQVEKTWCNYAKTPIPIGVGKYDDVLRCYVKLAPESLVATDPCTAQEIQLPESENGVYIVDFVFDDLSERSEKVSNAGHSGMSCMTMNGEFDGRHCIGPQRHECEEMSKLVDGGTRWDDKLEVCIMNTANSVANTQRALSIAWRGTKTAIGLATLVVTGGTAVTVITTVTSITRKATNIITTNQQRSSTTTLVQDLYGCYDKECVKRNLDTFIDHNANYLDNLNPDLLSSLDDVMTRKIDCWLSNEEKQNVLTQIDEAESRGCVEKVFSGEDSSSRVECIGEIVGKIGVVLGVTVSFAKIASNLTGLAGKVGNWGQFGGVSSGGEVLKTAKTAVGAINNATKVGSAIGVVDLGY